MQMDLSPHERFQKFRKRTRSQLQPSGLVCVPTVAKIKQRASLKQWTAPEVILDEGWTIYFGEIGIVSSTPSHIHIRNLLDGSIGIAVKTELFDSLLQGMLELKTTLLINLLMYINNKCRFLK
jgi:hypothetical protein